MRKTILGLVRALATAEGMVTGGASTALVGVSVETGVGVGDFAVKSERTV